MNDLTPAYNRQRHTVLPPPREDESDCLYILPDTKDFVSRTLEFAERIANDWENRFSDGHILFARVRSGKDIKNYLEEELRRLAHRDNIFMEIDRLNKFLALPVYKLNRPPRILKLPENSVSAVEKVNGSQPRTRDFLGERVIGLFLGSWYSLNWEYMPGVGRRRSYQLMHDNLPHACKAIFGEGYNPQNETEIRIRRADERTIRWRFIAALKDEDIPGLIKVLEAPGTQCYSAHLLAGNWGYFANDYEGLSYTDHIEGLDNTSTKIWHQTDVLTDWALANSAEIGTVEDLVKAGAVRWPADKHADKPFSIRRLLTAAASVFHEKTEREAYTEEKDRVFNEGLAAKKKRLGLGAQRQPDNKLLLN